MVQLQLQVKNKNENEMLSALASHATRPTAPATATSEHSKFVQQHKDGVCTACTVCPSPEAVANDVYGFSSPGLNMTLQARAC